MIRLRNVHMHYPMRSGRREILSGINLEIGRGEKLGVFGRNGAGKSTLVRLISGAELPTAGTIERTMSVSWPLAFGGAFQGSLTGRDNVRFISRIYDADFEKNMQSVEEFAELGRYLDEPVKAYSSGMRARLAFALSMIIEFDCFLIDEVSAVGDLRFHEKCEYELFEKRADRAMVIVSHDINYIQKHCTKFAVINDGKIEFMDNFVDSYNRYAEIMATPRLYQFPNSLQEPIVTDSSAAHTMKVLNHFIGKAKAVNSDKLFSADSTVGENILIDSNMTLMHASRITLDTRAHNLDRIRSLCRNAYLGGTDSLIRALGRYKMVVDTSDQGISCHLLLDGYWEIWVTEAIVSLVRPGMVVADVGANLGYFTMIMADLVGPAGRVHAFEPNPAMVQRLNRNVFVNGFAAHTRVHDVALSDTDGAAVSFMIPQAFPGGGTLNHHAAIPGDGSIQVATARLDSQADWMQIELMKVDVEGAEELVWRGAKGLFDSGALRTVLLEFNSERHADPADFLASIQHAGFAMSVIHHDQGIIATSHGELVETMAGHDVMLLLQR